MQKNSTESEDQELLERLRAKYATGAPGIPLDPNAVPERDLYAETSQAIALLDPSGPAAPAPSTTALRSSTGADISAAMCAVCHGSGLRIEEYNNRRLERCCDSCDGRGVTVSKNGVEVVLPTSNMASVEVARQKAIAQPATGGRGASRLATLAARIAEYEKERLRLMDSVSDSTGEEERRLKLDLVSQINGQLEKLGAIRDRQHEALYSSKTAATIGSSPDESETD